MANLSIDYEKYRRENNGVLQNIAELLKKYASDGDVMAKKLYDLAQYNDVCAGDWVWEIIKTLFEVKHDLEGRLLKKFEDAPQLVQIDLQSPPEKFWSAIIECLRNGAIVRMENLRELIPMPEEDKKNGQNER